MIEARRPANSEQESDRILEYVSVLSRALCRIVEPREAFALATHALHEGLVSKGTWTLVVGSQSRRFRIAACVPGALPPDAEFELDDSPAVEALRAGHVLWNVSASDIAPIHGAHLGPRAVATGRFAAFPVVCSGTLQAVLHAMLPGSFGPSSRQGERFGMLVGDLLSLALDGKVGASSWVGAGVQDFDSSFSAPEHHAAVETLGAVAHELNQPLTSILGYAELLGRKIDVDAAGGRYVEQLTREVERLAGLVERLTRVARYRTKPYVGRTEIFDLEASSPPVKGR